MYNLIAASWKSGCVGGIIDRVPNDVPHRHLWQSENFLQTFRVRFTVTLSRSGFVLGMMTRNNLVARIGFGTESGKEGGEQATHALLCDVFKVKVIRLDDGRTC